MIHLFSQVGDLSRSKPPTNIVSSENLGQSLKMDLKENTVYPEEEFSQCKISVQFYYLWYDLFMSGMSGMSGM